MVSEHDYRFQTNPQASHIVTKSVPRPFPSNCNHTAHRSHPRIPHRSNSHSSRPGAVSQSRSLGAKKVRTKLTNWLVKYDRPQFPGKCFLQNASNSPLLPVNPAASAVGIVDDQVPCYVMDAEDNSPLRTWRLTLAYDGTDYQGWQIQPGQPTIQGALQAALGRITAETPLPQGSGRTDAGVHALAQVASFQLRAPIPPENLLRALNRTLPASIRISDARTVQDASFHARHSAIAKTYEYRIHRSSGCSPFVARYVHCCAWPLDFESLQAAAHLFVGKHDFLSFAATDPDLAQRAADSREDSVSEMEAPSALLAPKESTIRTIYSSFWEESASESGTLLVYRVRGDGFLHHMVRNIVGTMLDVGRGHLAVEQLPTILAARCRSAAGPTAPARGLFLVSVDYPPEEDPNLGAAL
jgi:tRNA pseudouridine38-40 synthase